MTPLSDLTRAFARIGFLSFGGPAAQIALMHKVLVEERGWLSEAQFLKALSFCMMLPGPEAMQLATYAGWRLRGLRGGLIAGTLFVLPGAVVIAGLAALYLTYGSVPLVEAAFTGIQAAVIAIVLQALQRLRAKALGRPGAPLIAALAFAALFLFALPFPLVILAAALAGALVWRGASQPASAATEPVRLRRIALTVAAGLTLWLGPVALLIWAGPPLLADLAVFFSQLAVVTFGGAYAVLAYMTQDVVDGRGWLTTAEMMDGLGLAETTPGPLILVTQFVGHLAGHGAGGIAANWTLFWWGGLVTLWVTFVPCFLWIFAGAPLIDRLDRVPAIARALEGVTAAVVGVILNLSLWFAAHVLFAQVGVTERGPLSLITPDLASLNVAALALALLACALLLWRGWSVFATLGLSAALGVALQGASFL